MKIETIVLIFQINTIHLQNQYYSFSKSILLIRKNTVGKI